MNQKAINRGLVQVVKIMNLFMQDFYFELNDALKSYTGGMCLTHDSLLIMLL